MSNSALVNYIRLSPNHSGKRTHAIDTITIHHMAGNYSVETCGAGFAKTSRGASANYGIGSDGRIALYVDEANRSWASSSRLNDQRAVTIEVANCGVGPEWPVSDKAYAALLDLVEDICRRNGIKKLVWGNSKGDRVGHKNGCNMTVHQDFAATACPGPYLLSRMCDIAAEVDRRLEGKTKKEETELTEEQVRKLVRDELAKLEAERAALPASDWAREELAEAVAKGITDGTRPRSWATRQEVALMVSRAENKV